MLVFDIYAIHIEIYNYAVLFCKFLHLFVWNLIVLEI